MLRSFLDVHIDGIHDSLSLLRGKVVLLVRVCIWENLHVISHNADGATEYNQRVQTDMTQASDEDTVSLGDEMEIMPTDAPTGDLSKVDGACTLP